MSTTGPGTQPVEEQKAVEADKPLDALDADERPKGWPHQPIQDLEPEERDALLASGGPVGEMARVAQAQYENAQKREAEGPVQGAVASGPGSGVGMQEMPPPPPAGTVPEPSEAQIRQVQQDLATGAYQTPADDVAAKATEEAMDRNATQVPEPVAEPEPTPNNPNTP